MLPRRLELLLIVAVAARACSRTEPPSCKALAIELEALRLATVARLVPR